MAGLSIRSIFAALKNMTSKKTYNCKSIVSAVFMILALLWLTVSLPFVAESQNKEVQTSQLQGNDIPSQSDDDSNPLTNSTEEKTPGNGFSLSEEYLHDHHSSAHFFFEALLFHNLENTGTYVAFHGELLVPPPNIA